MTFYRDDRVTLHHGDALDVLRTLPDASVDSVVTDPPYGLGFMGKDWDRPGSAARGSKTDEALAANPYSRSRAEFGGASYGGDQLAQMRVFQQWCEQWAAECLRVLKPGGHLLAFGGTRTWHRLACAVEDAGFEVRDSIAWLYGSGFPKSLDVSKAIDKAARGVPQGAADPTSPNHGKYRTTTTEGKRWNGDSGQGYGAGGSRFLADGMASGSATEPVASGGVATAAEAREWEGWGTALKPAFEPVVVARKPLIGTVAANVTTHGTGALNIDACRIGSTGATTKKGQREGTTDSVSAYGHGLNGGGPTPIEGGRWPANVILDEDMAGVLDEQSGVTTTSAWDGNRNTPRMGSNGIYGDADATPGFGARPADSGGASRFFYVAKAPKRERPVVDGVAHPTVKPLALMRWLVRLATPPGGTVLEPFAGSGTTVEACLLEGFQCIAIEKGDEYLPLILARIHRQAEPVEPVRRVDQARAIAEQVAEQLDIFGEETA